MCVMGFGRTKGRASSIAARTIAGMFLGTRITVGDVGTSASSVSVVAVENVPMFWTMLIIVASVTRNVKVVWVVSMDTVVMHS